MTRVWLTGAPGFDGWLQRKLTGLAPGIRSAVEAWLRTLHDGGPRSRARHPATAWNYLNKALPSLHAWSNRYAHLREVTRDDIIAELDAVRRVGLIEIAKRPHGL